MPNWCYNYALITHQNPEKIAQLVKTIEDGKTFEHFIPLPDGEWDYDFCVDNWGTKWEICHPQINAQDDKMIDVYFETAWSPPIGVFEAMKKDGYTVQAEYWEEGAWFVGRWSDGVDECYKPEDAPDELSHLVENLQHDDEEAA